MLNPLHNYPLSQVTTLGIGGPATVFVGVRDEEELRQAISYAHKSKLNFLIIGSGSNLLVADAGFEGLVIKNEITGITQSDTRLTVHSGTQLAELVDYSIQQGLSGLQSLSGIPGTVGGALYGNAGAYGQTISDHLVSVTALDPADAKFIKFDKDDCTFGYRDSTFKKNGLIILKSEFQLIKSASEQLQSEAKKILEQRLLKYPSGIKCPGSFFKNIPVTSLPPLVLAKIPQHKIVYGKIPAGTLLEEVGAKGDSLNGITIAPYHANLFINTGSGTAADFFTLAKKYSDKVLRKFNIKLEPEVQLINLPQL